MTLEGVERFMAPTLRSDLPDPTALQDMEQGVDRLTRAVTEGETIGILADYDVDGATSSAVLVRFLRAVGADTVVHVPDRVTEGYGPNTRALAGLRERGAGLVVTLDCGTVAHDVLGEAADHGLDVIVVDHHMAEPVLPRGNRPHQSEPARRGRSAGAPCRGRRDLPGRCGPEPVPA